MISAVSFISLALIFYTVGVIGEFRSKRLNKKHLVFFYLGLICDTIGTSAMSKIASQSMSSGNALHGITGALALLIMFVHVVVATYALFKNEDAILEKFHKFSIVAWLIWLVPYFLGMFMGMM